MISMFSDEILPWVKEIDLKLHNSFFTVREAFRHFDCEKSGEVTDSKFLEGIAQMNVSITED